MIKRVLPDAGPTLIYHHLGLGDHIIISGGLKFLHRKGLLKKSFCISKQSYSASVQQLYADVAGLNVISVDNWEDANILAEQWKGQKFIVGFDKMEDWVCFDKDFYRIMNVDFAERWNSFSIQRNFEAETKVFEKINTPVEFAFVHDDASRGLTIDSKYVRNDLPVVRPYLTNSIFDWIGVLEKATEIHCICSSFKHLVDSLPNTNATLYYHHSYVNQGSARENSISASKRDWRFV